MKGRGIPYSPEELDWIFKARRLPRRGAWRMFCRHWQRDDVAFDNFKALYTRRSWKTGRTGCFPKGLVPHNKGKAMPPEVRAKCLPTAFKPGSLPPNRVPLWSERLAYDGYVEMKVPERNPHTGHPTRFVAKHVWLWERAHGPVPEGHVLKCLDGDRTNTDPANWTPVPRAMLPRLAGTKGRVAYDEAPDEVKPALLTLARIEHRVRTLREEATA